MCHIKENVLWESSKQAHIHVIINTPVNTRNISEKYMLFSAYMYFKYT